ncbi:MAG TPA: hypothetical protein VFE42_07370 [Chloroflexota bacterium]|nr:hypothetical protein [Chloroflexota bacterium]
MPWQAFHRCSCCQECVFLEGMHCRFHGDTRRFCNGDCPDRLLAADPADALTEEERERCQRLTTHPAARFPLLTLEEMRRLLWYREYFGEREHQNPTRPFPRLSPHDRKVVERFIRPAVQHNARSDAA